MRAAIAGDGGEEPRAGTPDPAWAPPAAALREREPPPGHVSPGGVAVGDRVTALRWRGVARALNVLRVGAGLLGVGVLSVPALAVLLVLLPSRLARVYAVSVWAKTVGWLCVRLSGVRVEIVGRERLRAAKPAIFAGNHASLLDVLLLMWLLPCGTTAVAKKEILWVPLVGLVYTLSGSLRIDRGDRPRAVAALAAQARFLRRGGLSVAIWPEGTRSRTGRLLPLKKGFAHLALQTRLPVVPVVVSGAHRAWRVGGLRIQEGARVRVEIGAPIPTDGWSRERLNEHVEEVARVFRALLPPDQQPLPPAAPGGQLGPR